MNNNQQPNIGKSALVVILSGFFKIINRLITIALVVICIACYTIGSTYNTEHPVQQKPDYSGAFIAGCSSLCAGATDIVHKIALGLTVAVKDFQKS